MLEFKNVSYKNKKFSLNNISFTADEGYITAITGTNGAGKTTLLNLISKETSAYDGEILFLGRNIKEWHNEFRGMLGIVSDERYFFDACSANDNVRMLSHFYPNWNQDVFKEEMARMNVSGGKLLNKLSRGEYIRFQLAFAKAHGARLYILDEATGGMDPVFRKDFFKDIHELIANQPVTVIMTTHIEEDIEKHMDYIGILEKGNLISFKEVE